MAPGVPGGREAWAQEPGAKAEILRMPLSAIDAAAPHGALPAWVWASLTVLSAVVLLLLGLQWRQYQQRQRRRLGLPGKARGPALLSREAFDVALEDAVAHADQTAGAVCLLLINLDNLDAVNQGYGHRQTDELIASATQRLVAESGGRLPMTRMGGVDFALLAPMDKQAACALAGRLCEALATPLFPVEGRAAASMSCSIGLAIYPTHGARQRLIDHASTAMRLVKRAGGSDYMVFDPKMAVDHREQAELLADLRQAVDRGQLELYYQPKVDARSMQFTAAEALLRWHHPTRGMISPALFIPMAERHGLIGTIGNWVIEDATRQAAAWRAVGLRMRVAINISAYQMRQDDLVDRIQQALARHNLQPSRFTCEITESVAMEDTRVTQRSFERMRKAGLHVSIDDFGVGQASLSYLRRLPAAELKIDASFVQDLESNADARSIIDAVVRLAHALNLRVVAEGVETERQRDLLVKMDCDELQGFLFAKPMSATALTTLASLDDDRQYGGPSSASGSEKSGFRDSLFQETTPQAF